MHFTTAPLTPGGRRPDLLAANAVGATSTHVLCSEDPATGQVAFQLVFASLAGAAPAPMPAPGPDQHAPPLITVASSLVPPSLLQQLQLLREQIQGALFPESSSEHPTGAGPCVAAANVHVSVPLILLPPELAQRLITKVQVACHSLLNLCNFSFSFF
jgi:hypothetical protein